MALEGAKLDVRSVAVERFKEISFIQTLRDAVAVVGRIFKVDNRLAEFKQKYGSPGWRNDMRLAERATLKAPATRIKGDTARVRAMADVLSGPVDDVKAYTAALVMKNRREA